MKKGDKIAFIVISIIILLSFVVVFYYKSSLKSDNTIAIIQKDGKILRTINLKDIKKEERIKVSYEDEKFNDILIEPGKIRFDDSTCPDKLCVKSGWISKPGDIAVCLPYKVIIKIDAIKNKVDAVSY